MVTNLIYTEYKTEKGLIPMQIENTGAFIVSGVAPAAETKKRPPERTVKPARVYKAVRRGSFKKFFAEYAASLRDRRKRIMCVAAGAAVTLAGVTALGAYCTVGVDYYCGGRLLCTVAAADDAAGIIAGAIAQADKLGAPEPKIETAPKLALKSALVDGDEAVDAILEASPYLCRAYAATVDGETLAAAGTREEVESALAAYVEKYRLNDSAALSAEVDIEEQIVRKSSLLSGDELEAALEKGDTLAVINTVDLVEQQTLPHETEEVKDESLYAGDSVVETEGSDGVIMLTNEQIYRNGELLSSAIVSSETTLEPVAEVVRVGTKPRNALVDGFSYPLSGRLSSGFGPRWGRTHRGIDLAVAMDTPVKAAAAGTVITAEYKPSYGNIVQIDHGYGIVTSYAHLDYIDVSVGQSVARGEVVAHSGSTGNSTGPHLHFEVINNGEYLNPLDYLI